jgi:hypothetical protein
MRPHLCASLAAFPANEPRLIVGKLHLVGPLIGGHGLGCLPKNIFDDEGVQDY